MILVDSSVWIDHLRDTVTGSVSQLRSLISGEELLVGDLILCEVLQGLRTDPEARLVEDALREFEVVFLVDAELAVKAAANHRFAPPRDHDPKDDKPPHRHILYRARSHPVAQQP